MRLTPILAATLLLTLPAAAGETASGAVVYDSADSYDDTLFALENAIIGQGLVVDHTSKVGEMLARTGADLGAEVQIFDNAEVLQFCSAVLSRQVMEADPLNIAHCPYGVFVLERGGQVQVGYRALPEGPMQEVQALLDAIAREAAGQ
jgi:uncharacterized protein (DUF302 family)